ncbi:hypothetical protein PWG71_21375 [Nocardiopsis sp. N85]|uniref:hypothetical protein n=1 Tax=Nocardiopsis sp. N85 TaxID=3029400 RepID=UPI00237F1DBF|nr:hypothetical protein [Nocardiopsis sp. N85]MDE3723950.1 hypothetical protein [Nocardiopsis sp. N85]
MAGSLPADGSRTSHEAVHTWTYDPNKGETARLGIVLPFRRTARHPQRKAERDDAHDDAP